MTVKHYGTRVAVLTALRDAIDEIITEERHEITNEMENLSKSFGVKSIDIELPNGVLVATVSFTPGASKPTVESEQKFVAWVRSNAPTEVVQTVRDSYKKVLLERLVDGGDGVAIDPNSGIVVEGVTFRETNPRMVLRYKKEGREEVAKAYNAGELDSVIRPLLGSPSPVIEASA